MKLYAANTTTTNAAASIQFPRRGRIRGLLCTCGLVAGADSTRVYNELSFSNVNQVATNDTIGPIAGFENYQRWTTGTPQGMATINQFVPCDVAVNAGDRLYLNQLIGGTVTTEATTVYVYIDD